MTEQRGAGKAVIDAIAQTMEANTSRKVFGDAVTVGDVTVIPAARVSGPASPCAKTVTGEPSPLTRTSKGPVGPSISSKRSACLHGAQNRPDVSQVDEGDDRADQVQY
jgi:hypothetical protein